MITRVANCKEVTSWNKKDRNSKTFFFVIEIIRHNIVYLYKWYPTYNASMYVFFLLYSGAKTIDIQQKPDF